MEANKEDKLKILILKTITQRQLFFLKMKSQFRIKIVYSRSSYHNDIFPSFHRIFILQRDSVEKIIHSCS